MLTLGSASDPTNVTISGGTLSIDLAGLSSDLLKVIGNLDINGATLVVSGIPTGGAVFNIASATSISGTFSSIPMGYNVIVSADMIRLVAVPEPTCLGVIALLAIGALFLRIKQAKMSGADGTG